MDRRSIDLDLSTPSSRRTGSRLPAGQLADKPDQESQREFEGLLNAQPDPERDPKRDSERDSKRDPEPEAGPPSSPPVPRVSLELLQTPAAARVDLGQLRSSVSALLVGDGPNGRRQAGMRLDEDVLPGVVLHVYEEGGAHVAEFSCGDEDSRRLLCEIGARLAQEWANALGGRTEVRVVGRDGEDVFVAASQAR